MEKKMVKWMKRAASSILAVALVVAGSFMVDTMAEAVDETYDTVQNEKGIIYQEFTDYSKYIGEIAPTYTGTDSEGYGYVFGGWFTSSSDTTFKPINAAPDDATTTVYAKFVPAYVLSVKCQNQAGTAYQKDGGSGSTNLKVVSSMDSVNYEAYGFDLYTNTLDGNGNIATHTRFSKENDTATTVYRTFKVYASANDDKPNVNYPTGVFGDASAYFTTWGVTGIPESSYGTIIHIKPYWITLDGTKVYGLSKYAHVEDGLVQEINGEKYQYVNVPVNLRATQPVAAGVLSVDYEKYTTENGFTFYEAEGGVIFEEMAWSDKGTSIKLVGNVSDVTKNDADKQEDDIYVNLRFKVPVTNGTASDFSNGFTFTVNGEDFCNVEEKTCENYDVWNVKY